jgi:hypothetical protein
MADKTKGLTGKGIVPPAQAVPSKQDVQINVATGTRPQRPKPKPTPTTVPSKPSKK